MELETFNILLFTAFNWLRVFAFIPQIICVLRDKHGARAISYTSYSLFAGAHAATALYALTPLNDMHLLIVSIAALASCITVILATAWSRRRYVRSVLAGGAAREFGPMRALRTSG